MVAESDCLDDFKNGWDYALGHFIELYKEALQQYPQEEYLEKIELIQHHTVYRSSSINPFDGAKNEVKNVRKRKEGGYNLRII